MNGWRITWRVILLVGLTLLGWRIAALGISNHAVEAIKRGQDNAAQQALRWEPRQPKAALRVALERIEEDPEEARRRLTQAYLGDPTDPFPLLVLAGLAQARGDQPNADALVGLAGDLRPVDPRLQQDVARYWMERSRFDLALRHWSITLEANPDARTAPRTGTSIFESLRRMLDDPGGVEALRRLALAPPAWWLDFFADTAAPAHDVELLRILYRLRRQSETQPLTPRERAIYTERLITEGLLTEAYLAWVNSLGPDGRQYLGPLHNGSFELPFTNQGFDWQIIANDRVEIARTRLEGTEHHALRLRFHVSRKPFNHLFQPLFLAAGAYEVSGTSRGSELYTDRGMRWIIGCRSPQGAILGESDRIFGSEEWTPFSFQLEIPESCIQQELRLVTAGTPNAEQPIEGELWFDDLAIRRIDALTPLAKAQSEARRFE